MNMPVIPAASGAEAPGREFHAVAELFPLLRGAAFEELAADIRRNGLREPILCDAEGRILDGRNRYRACLQAGVEPRFVTWQGDGSLPELALSLNLRRRHLDESQRAMVAARLAKMMEGQAVKRKGRRTDLAANLQPGKRCRSSAESAALVNVSERLVHSASRVVNEGCDELIAAVESGQIAVSTASVLAGLPREEQARVVAGGVQEIARRVRERRAGDRAQPAPSFGVVSAKATAMPAGGVLLWVASSGLAAAVEGLKKIGFRYVPSEP